MPRHDGRADDRGHGEADAAGESPERPAPRLCNGSTLHGVRVLAVDDEADALEMDAGSQPKVISHRTAQVGVRHSWLEVIDQRVEAPLRESHQGIDTWQGQALHVAMARSNITLSIFATLTLGALLVGQDAAAQAPVRFDIEGSWQADATRPMQCVRSGTSVGATASCLLVNQGFAHQFELRYVTPTSLGGNVTRRNRATGCVTRMSVTVVLQSESSFTLTWTALDSGCDLKAGQSGTDPMYSRLL